MTQLNQERRDTFVTTHDPKSAPQKNMEYRSLLLCSSTDESSFDDQSMREYGWTIISKNRVHQSNSIKNAGKSYRDNRSKSYGESLKHSKFKIHVIATICLDPTNFIPAFKINTCYTDGSVFGEFVENRNLPEHILYDIQDRHKLHSSIQANINRGTTPVQEIYENEGIVQDFIPAAMPQLDPVELLFGYITKYLKDESPKYIKNGSWEAVDLIKIVKEAKESVTFEHVRSWYQRTFTEMFPNSPLPVYLQPDTSVEKLQREIERQKNAHKLKGPETYITRSGRVTIINKI
jgi:hypothetical protein